MDEFIGINLELPLKFSIELDRKILDLRETGVKKTKAQYIIELARAELLHRTIKIEI